MAPWQRRFQTAAARSSRLSTWPGMETPPLDERRLFFDMVHEHRVPEFLCHEWPLFWQPEFTDKPPMWQSGLAGVVLSMQSAYTVRIVFAYRNTAEVLLPGEADRPSSCDGIYWQTGRVRRR